MTIGARSLWRDLEVMLKPGTMAGLVGPSGSGKSTLLHCVGLLTKPSGGRIAFAGRELTRLGPGAARRFRRDHLGYLFQNYALIEDATVRDNLLVSLRARRRRGGPTLLAMAESPRGGRSGWSAGREGQPSIWR